MPPYGQDEGDVPLTTKMDRYMLLFKALVIYEARQVPIWEMDGSKITPIFITYRAVKSTKGTGMQR